MQDLLLDKINEVLSLPEEDLVTECNWSEEEIEAMLLKITKDPKNCISIGFTNSLMGACCCTSIAPNNTCSVFITCV